MYRKINISFLRKNDKFKQMAEIFKALSYSKRLRILFFIIEKKSSVSPTEISQSLRIPIATVDRHIRKLEKEKYLYKIRKGLLVKYNIERRHKKIITDILNILKLHYFPFFRKSGKRK